MDAHRLGVRRLVGVRALATALTAIALASTGILLSPAVAAQAPTQVTAEPAEAEASTAILVTNVSGLDIADGTYDASFYLAITCSSPCDASEWDILNARSSTRALVSESGLTTWWLVSGVFTFSPDLRLFPFDTQDLPIQIEHGLLDGKRLTFVADPARSEVASDVTISGWEPEAFTFTSSTTHYASEIADYSRLTFTLPVTRSTLAGVVTYYIPLAIFVLLGAATLVLSRNDYQIRVGGTALVGLTVFYLATSGGVGFSGTLTLWDASVVIGYLSLGLVLLSGITGAHLFNEGAFDGPEGALRNKRLRFRFLYALIALVAVGAAAIATVAIMT
jgi:hypothetical protein